MSTRCVAFDLARHRFWSRMDEVRSTLHEEVVWLSCVTHVQFASIFCCSSKFRMEYLFPHCIARMFCCGRSVTNPEHLVNAIALTRDVVPGRFFPLPLSLASDQDCAIGGHAMRQLSCF
ncbi:hypothetical protein FVE85_9392 [Porphyridium purpureum]|uniref:Uncharacterized protein n=1 Tax=Porphyridium purpureum TaxID=35688 RepID=A0A5J4YGL4_PORPP|nr:hypothetical protein FVE85_9392 [Porphyridium purpureum]|eukprot:POR1724..scf255_21